MPNLVPLATQPDLFIPDISFLRPKALRDLSATNWFSLSKLPRHTPIAHSLSDTTTVTVTNATGRGIATIYDHDILIFIVSAYVAAINSGRPTSPTMLFTGYELDRFLRPFSKSRPDRLFYERVWASLQRLHTTHVHVRLPTSESQFYWLPHITRTRRRISPDERTGYVVALDPALYAMATNVQNSLTLDHGYFSLTSPLARFVYLWARKSIGYRPTVEWSESVDRIYSKSASLEHPRKFLARLRRTVADARIPGYELSLTYGRNHALQLTARRAPLKLPASHQ